MWFEHEATPISVDESVALTPINLLSSIITAWPPGLGGLDALAISNRAGGTGLSSNSFAVEHEQRVIDLLEATVVAEYRKPAIDRAPRRESLGSRRHGQPDRIT